LSIADHQIDRATIGGRQERQIDLAFHFLRRLRPARPSAAPAAAKKVAEAAAGAEELTKNLGGFVRIDLLVAARTAAPAKSRPARSAHAAVRADLAKAVELGALGLVAEHVVGVLYFFEPRFGLLVAGIAIGVILAGKLAIGFLYVIVGCVAFDPERLVII